MSKLKLGNFNWGRIALHVCACNLLLAGCAVVGPEAIRSGRLAYNEAIKETSNQQMLMVLVHNRYDETHQLLNVSSVTANVRISSQAQVQTGFGDGDDYAGNLVPFSGGFIYEENPTISYQPVSGEAYLRQITSPLPLSLFTAVTHAQPNPEYTYDILLSSVNGIRNTEFLYYDQQDDPRFDRFVELMTELTHRHSLNWAEVPDKKHVARLVIIPDSERSIQLVTELLDLLGIGHLSAQDGIWSIPVYKGYERQTSDGITITTRSVWDLMEIITGSVEVPVEDDRSGAAVDFPRPGRAGRQLHIYFAESKPEKAYIAVEHRGGWFYIDETDKATKRYFKLLSSLWSAVMSLSLDSSTSMPVLTVPVSR